MNTAINAFLLVYAGLFPVVNPVGAAPIFLALTANRGIAVRRALALRVALNGFLLLLGALFLGSHVLFFFGITVPVLRIAGGLASPPLVGTSWVATELQAMRSHIVIQKKEWRRFIH
jgi:multiple antibiotic resistance protein